MQFWGAAVGPFGVLVLHCPNALHGAKRKPPNRSGVLNISAKAQTKSRGEFPAPVKLHPTDFTSLWFLKHESPPASHLANTHKGSSNHGPSL